MLVAEYLKILAAFAAYPARAVAVAHIVVVSKVVAQKDAGDNLA